MDGSVVTVVILGDKGVGKKSFVKQIEKFSIGIYRNPFIVDICGHQLKILFVTNPDRSILIPTTTIVILLFDLTNEASFTALTEAMETARRVSPVSLRAVIGTKADLVDKRKISTERVLEFCRVSSEGSHPMPYYETALEPMDCVFIAFQEVVARPLINEHILKSDTEQEQISFAHEIMDWALLNNSANMLTHLRSLGYAVPSDLIERDPVLFRDYLMSEYPLQIIPHFRVLELEETLAAEGFEDSELEDFDKEPLAVQDTRPTIEVTPAHHLLWSDISLTCFPPSLLPTQPHLLTHIDVSNNNLSTVPTEFFQLSNVETLNISHNRLTQLPCFEHWNTESNLQVLYASHNCISCDAHSPLLYRHGERGRKRPFRELWCVDLSWNDLGSFPMFVLHFPLKVLNISYNLKVMQLPVELGKLALSFLHIDGLHLVDPPPFVVAEGTQEIINYLKLRGSSSSPWSSIRVAIVGEGGAGKTYLVHRLAQDTPTATSPTKGLQVVEWKYKGGDILTFRNRWFRFDLWDFSGNPEYRCIYSCVNCSSSVHLVVASATRPHDELVKWLSDIQAMSPHRVPVVIVFTHMDHIKTKEARDEFKRQRQRWIDYHNKKADDQAGETVSLQVSLSASVRSLPGDKGFASSTVPQEAFDMEQFAGYDIPLMPLVIKTHFISNLTGEGVASIRKTLYKIVTGSFSPSSRVLHPILRLVRQEVPLTYVRLEQIIRNMRNSRHKSQREGEQRPFYTLEQFGELLAKPMKEARIRESDLIPGLRFLHNLGFVLIHECSFNKSLLVSVDPQMVGYLLQRMIKAGIIAKEAEPASFYLPNTHLFMLWGVDPIWSHDVDHTHTVSPRHILDFLYSTNMFSPLLPGILLLPSLLPHTLPRSCDPESDLLVPRRTYFFSYLPSFFSAQLIARVVSKLQPISSPRPLSPGQTTSTLILPIVTPTGYRVHLWRRNLFIEDTEDNSKVWVYVREGKVVGPDTSPHCGRVDILLDAPLEREAVWLRLITTEIDQLIPQEYSLLLEPPNQVESFFPLRPDTVSSMSTEETRDISCAPPLPNCGSLPTGSPSLSQMSDHSEWEVISKHSTTSTRLSMKVDLSSPQTHLIPVWECLQEAFKAPVIQVNSSRLILRNVIPDLLFADLPPELLLRTTVSSPDQYLLSLEDYYKGGGSPTDKETGLHLRSYYTPQDADIYVEKPTGAAKTLHLQSLLSRIRGDLETLRKLHCPYLVVPVGIHYCPPSLALESAPCGSLTDLLQQRGTHIGRDVIHHISMQLLQAIDFFHNQNVSYHSINSDNVLIWSMDPLQVKLSDQGITHSSASCNLCRYLGAIPNHALRIKTARRCDYILLGFLVYQMATGKRPYEDIHSLEMLVIATLAGKVNLNVEADHFLQNQQVEERNTYPTGCQRLCLQSAIDGCVTVSQPLSASILQARFSLCAGDHQWSPMRLHVNVEAMVCSEDADLIYWASGSRGLVTGTIHPLSGELLSNILQEAPPPESGMFANRRAKPVPIAVGRATSVALVSCTQQLWVGTENGQMGSVYVFKLPDMRRHHHIHLQDAVLSICAVNNITEKLGSEGGVMHRVLVGLANGTVILFLGVRGEKVLENPLQGPKQIVTTCGHKPCLSLELTRDGYIWCSVGECLEVFDMKTLKSVRRLNCQIASESLDEAGRSGSRHGDVIILMCVNSLGVWTVTRRSHILRLWNQLDGSLLSSYSIQNIILNDDPDITALSLHGGAVWLGTRNGYVFVLDANKMSNGVDDPLLGMQFCGEGKVREILPLKPWKKVSPKLEVLCSMELADEISGVLLSWEYLPQNHSPAPTQTARVMSRTVSSPRGVAIATRVRVDMPTKTNDELLELCKSI